VTFFRSDKPLNALHEVAGLRMNVGTLGSGVPRLMDLQNSLPGVSLVRPIARD
jgi:hypothetical protein